VFWLGSRARWGNPSSPRPGASTQRCVLALRGATRSARAGRARCGPATEPRARARRGRSAGARAAAARARRVARAGQRLEDDRAGAVAPRAPQAIDHAPDFDNRFSTTGTEGQAEALCLYAASTAICKDTWWTWTPSQTASVEFSTCGQVSGGTDTRIAIYNGAGCPIAPAIACNDDAGALCPAAGFNTILSFNAVCGQTYTVPVGNFAAAASLYGTFTITESAGTLCGPPATPICFGDGTGLACPCLPNGSAGNGCANSLNPNGGNLLSSGTASIANDTFTLLGSGMPNASALYFQGTSVAGRGNGVLFGDGIRCSAGTIIRLGTKPNVGGISQYPAGAETIISVRGLNASGDFRVYQVCCRNAAAFCTVNTFNLTNAASVTWAP